MLASGIFRQNIVTREFGTPNFCVAGFSLERFSFEEYFERTERLYFPTCGTEQRYSFLNTSCTETFALADINQEGYTFQGSFVSASDLQGLKTIVPARTDPNKQRCSLRHPVLSNSNVPNTSKINFLCPSGAGVCNPSGHCRNQSCTVGFHLALLVSIQVQNLWLGSLSLKDLECWGMLSAFWLQNCGGWCELLPPRFSLVRFMQSRFCTIAFLSVRLAERILIFLPNLFFGILG